MIFNESENRSVTETENVFDVHDQPQLKQRSPAC